jgi:hypothetical protein
MARRPTRARPEQGLARRPSTGIPDPYAANATGVADNTRSVGTVVERLLTTREAANILRLSESWLAKARMRGDGPPYVKLSGRTLSPHDRYNHTT